MNQIVLIYDSKDKVLPIMFVMKEKRWRETKKRNDQIPPWGSCIYLTQENRNVEGPVPSCLLDLDPERVNPGLN